VQRKKIPWFDLQRFIYFFFFFFASVPAVCAACYLFINTNVCAQLFIDGLRLKGGNFSMPPFAFYCISLNDNYNIFNVSYVFFIYLILFNLNIFQVSVKVSYTLSIFPFSRHFSILQFPWISVLNGLQCVSQYCYLVFMLRGFLYVAHLTPRPHCDNLMEPNQTYSHHSVSTYSQSHYISALLPSIFTLTRFIPIAMIEMVLRPSHCKPFPPN